MCFPKDTGHLVEQECNLFCAIIILLNFLHERPQPYGFNFSRVRWSDTPTPAEVVDLSGYEKLGELHRALCSVRVPAITR